jgi:1,4-dihydroxy-2-naphthoate octaprenyltransferase
MTPHTAVTSNLRAWWLAIRPFSLPASIVPVLVGTAVAAGETFRPGLFALALLGSVLIHAGTNLATDFFDFMHGVQPGATLGGVIRGGLIAADAVHRAAIACFVLGAACGLVIVAYTGWPVLAAGIASVLAGYFYTAKPISYGRRGLGEIGVFIFMGLLMVMASYYVQVERLSWAPFWAAVPVAILVANILHANNLRDIENDRARAKVTVATLIDRPAADYGLWLLTLSAFVVVIAAVATGGLPVMTLLTLAALPAASSTLQRLREREASKLNALVRASAGLHLQFGVLLALGLVLDAVLG